MVRDLKVRRLNAPKGSRHGQRESGPSDPEGCMEEIRDLRVEALWEERVRRILKLLKPEESKWIMTVRYRRTCIDRSCISGESTSRGREHEVETSEGRSPKVDQSR
jgi:hypothetical protein